MKSMNSMKTTQAKSGKLSGKGLKVILIQCVRHISMLDAGGNIKSRMRAKGRGERKTVASHHLGLATERKAQSGPGEAPTTIVLKCKCPLWRVTEAVGPGEAGSRGRPFGLKKKVLL